MPAKKKMTAVVADGELTRYEKFEAGDSYQVSSLTSHNMPSIVSSSFLPSTYLRCIEEREGHIIDIILASCRAILSLLFCSFLFLIFFPSSLPFLAFHVSSSQVMEIARHYQFPPHLTRLHFNPTNAWSPQADNPTLPRKSPKLAFPLHH